MRYGNRYLPAACLAALLGCMALLAAFTKKPAPAKAPRPNIIVILADDMGYSDLGCYGGEVHTPNIDSLAHNGICYTQFYNTSRCCPTRASLLTGLYNHDAGIGHMTGAEDAPGYRGHLTDNCVTLAEVLKTAGYQTAMVGKWHVSNTNEQATPQAQQAWMNHQLEGGDFSPLSQYPTSRGFDKFYGTIWGVVDYYDPFSLVNGTTPVKQVPAHYYQTDAIADTAAAYIRQLSRSGSPFFLYVAQNAPHWPLMAPEEEINKYKDTYTAGWEAAREARYHRMAAMGLIDTNTTQLSTRWQSEKDWAANPHKAYDARVMATHAAMIDRMDQGIGRILAALKASGQLDNTLTLVLSDNGASAENCAAYGPGFDRPSETRDGRRIVYDLKKKVLPGPETTYVSIGQQWANVANTPYRYWKEQSFEGGIHTPLIAFWPKGIKTHGGFNNHVGHVMDFMRTFTDLTGAQYPTIYKGHTIKPTAGVSLVPSFNGKEGSVHEALFNEHFGARYARVGDWKIVSLSNDSTWHLYNLAQDRTETQDLATRYPGRVQEMAARWWVWAQAHQVIPRPGRK